MTLKALCNICIPTSFNDWNLLRAVVASNIWMCPWNSVLTPLTSFWAPDNLAGAPDPWEFWVSESHANYLVSTWMVPGASEQSSLAVCPSSSAAQSPGGWVAGWSWQHCQPGCLAPGTAWPWWKSRTTSVRTEDLKEKTGKCPESELDCHWH